MTCCTPARLSACCSRRSALNSSARIGLSGSCVEIVRQVFGPGGNAEFNAACHRVTVTSLLPHAPFQILRACRMGSSAKSLRSRMRVCRRPNRSSFANGCSKVTVPVVAGHGMGSFPGALTRQDHLPHDIRRSERLRAGDRRYMGCESPLYEQFSPNSPHVDRYMSAGGFAADAASGAGRLSRCRCPSTKHSCFIRRSDGIARFDVASYPSAIENS